MDKKTLQAKLDEFVKLGNELDAEAKRKYGPNGFLFHEADGGVHIMSGDDISGGSAKRQKYVKMSKWGAGAW
jgi:hypothetical protein